MGLSDEQKQKIREKANLDEKSSSGKYCKYCGSVIDTNTSVCPSCGQNLNKIDASSRVIYVGDSVQKKSMNRVFLEILIGVLIIAGLGMTLRWLLNSKKSSSETVIENETDSVVHERIVSEQKDVYGIDDTVDLNGVYFTFLGSEDVPNEEISWLSGDDGTKYSLMEFEVWNHTDESIVLNSFTNFSLYLDGAVINQSLVGWLVEDKNSLDGIIAANERLSGVICYKLPIGFDKVEMVVSYGKIPESATFVYENCAVKEEI